MMGVWTCGWCSQVARQVRTGRMTARRQGAAAAQAPYSESLSTERFPVCRFARPSLILACHYSHVARIAADACYDFARCNWHRRFCPLFSARRESGTTPSVLLLTSPLTHIYQAMHAGVIRDYEQQRLKRERQADFEMQRALEEEYRKVQTVSDSGGPAASQGGGTTP